MINSGHGPWGPGPWGGAGGGHGRHGPPPWVTGLFGGPPGTKRGPRVRRGDVRAAILDVLSADGPMNGYQIINRIAERTSGAWKPSPGSVYPTMQQLEDEALIETTTASGRKESALTDAGHDYVAEHPQELAATWQPFDEDDDDDAVSNLRSAAGPMMAALWQVATTASPEQQAEAAKILSETKRKLYGLLADGDPPA